MKSMTGYGKAKIQRNQMDVEIEIKSINGRYLDLRIYTPRELSFFEYEVRKTINTILTRGTIEIRVIYTDHREPPIELNEAKLTKYYDLVLRAKQFLHLNEDVSLEYLLAEPGVLESSNDLEKDQDVAQLLHDALKQALDKLVITLQAEAKQIEPIIIDSMKRIDSTLEKIESQIEPYKEQLFKNLKERTLELIKTPLTENLEQRMFQEIAMYIDKYDVQEEITRLRSHISTVDKTLAKQDDNGKGLNFVLQEMQREANTLGSKFSTSESFPYILIIKEEIEKCREIIQNVA
jgi:uncharacterized protein (TIGR00255 family)